MAEEGGRRVGVVMSVVECLLDCLGGAGGLVDLDVEEAVEGGGRIADSVFERARMKIGGDLGQGRERRVKRKTTKCYHVC